MKISKSKQELARIISENGGWRDGVEFFASTCDGIVIGSKSKPKYTSKYGWVAAGGFIDDRVELHSYLKNWHQTILSREEYFHLYQAQVAKSQFCESVMRSITEPDERVWTNQPAIEQLAADYRNLLDFAQRKRQEADDAKADADEKLRVLELAGEALGMLVSPITAKQEHELVITEWRDLQAGDVISVSGKWWGPDSEYTVDENDGSRDAPIRVGGYWAFIGECSFKFISRP